MQNVHCSCADIIFIPLKGFDYVVLQFIGNLISKLATCVHMSVCPWPGMNKCSCVNIYALGIQLA